MTFLWPNMLWLLAAVPIVVAAYLWAVRRRTGAALRYPGLNRVREALGPGHNWRRHVPPLLFLVALVTIILATARPAAVITLPSRNERIILAMDVSGSMSAKDVRPNRLAAAQAAAKAFVADQPSSVRIGVVSFAATASVVQAPTRNHDDIIAAIDRFQLQYGTAIGSGIIVSMATLFPDAGYDVSEFDSERDSHGGAAGPASGTPDKGGGLPAKPVAPGSYDSAAIILLTDGQSTTGPDAMGAARLAAKRGVRIFTVGVGTTAGEVMRFEGWRMRVRLDEEILKKIADLTRGDYFYAGTADELKKIYRKLNAHFVLEKKRSEITALFSAAAAVTALAAALLSVLWFNRIL